MIGSETDAQAWCARHCDEEAMRRLEEFVALLAAENARQNLISAKSLVKVWQRHIADSFQLSCHVPNEQHGPWLDLGSGPGLPGLISAIARQENKHILVESRRKRHEWLEHVVSQLGLTNVDVKGERLENVKRVDAGVITARAFAPLGRLLNLSARFSTRSTIWLLPKGRSAAQELAEQSNAVRAMFHVEQSLTDPEASILVGRGRPPRP
ncbi:MAG: 16S rRNA (guanine(527)-N(7))-methyltransferase RsmG [Alteraurantiacibacter sp.]